MKPINEYLVNRHIDKNDMPAEIGENFDEYSKIKITPDIYKTEEVNYNECVVLVTKYLSVLYGNVNYESAVKAHKNFYKIFYDNLQGNKISLCTPPKERIYDLETGFDNQKHLLSLTGIHVVYELFNKLFVAFLAKCAKIDKIKV